MLNISLIKTMLAERSLSDIITLLPPNNIPTVTLTHMDALVKFQAQPAVGLILWIFVGDCSFPYFF